MPVASSRRAAYALWAVLVAAVVLPTMLFAYVAFRDYNGFLDRAEERGRETVAILREHAQKVFDTEQLAMDLIEARIHDLDWPEIVRQQADIGTLIKSIVARFPQFVVMGLMDPEGRIIGSPYLAPLAPAPAERDYVQAMLSGYQGTFIGAPRMGNYSRQRQFFSARPLARSSQSFQGAVQVAIGTDYFSRAWRAFVQESPGVVTMFREDGAVLSSTDPNTEAMGQLHPDSPVMAVKGAAAQSGVIMGRAVLDGVERLYAYQRLSTVPVYVVYAVDRDTIFAPWRQQLWQYGLLDLVIMLCLVAMTGFAMRHVQLQQRAADALGAEIEIRKRAEAEALKSQEDFRFLYLKTPVMLHSIDPDRRIINVSDFWLEHTGYGREEVIGRRMSDFLTPASRARLQGVAFPTLRQTGYYNQMPLQFIRKDGSIRDLLVDSRAEFNSAGEMMRSLTVSFDMTEWKRLESELRQAQRMESIGNLTGGVAHDFNNLLTVILANLDTAHRHAQSGQPVGRAVEAAQRAAERGASLTRQLLAFARRQPLEPSSIDVQRLLARVARFLQRTLGEHVEVETVTGAGLWPAFCDPAQLENALVNLAINARDAMPSGGKLSLEAGNVTLDEEYASRHVEVKAGRYVMLAVSDTGTGMSPEVMEQAFEPFFTTKPEGKGTGLGLSQVFGFIKQSQGHVRIYSEEGHGTTVKMYLPRATAEPAAPAEAVESEEPPRGSELVLVVEDDADVRQAAVDILVDLGYSVLEAADPEEGLAILREHSPALLFTDVVMPGAIDATELVRQARMLRPEIRVLYTSGYTENAVVHNGRIDHEVELLSKPYKRDQLARRVRRLLDRKATARA